MTNYNVELDADTVDDIIAQSLFQTRSRLLVDYIAGNVGVFDFNPVEDRRQIGDVISALEIVIDWYSVPGSYTFDALPVFDVKDIEDA